MTASHLVPLITWSLALVVHETLLTAGAVGLVAAGGIRRPQSLERLWKAVLLAGILTATLQSVYGFSLIRFAVIPQTAQLKYMVERTVIIGGTHSTVTTARYLTHPPNPTWPLLVLLLWSLVSGLRLAVSLHAHRRFVLTLRARQRVVDPDLLRITTSLSGLAGLTAPPVLTSSESVSVPVVLSAREICLPLEITQVLDPAEMRMLLAHEIAHIVRGDQRWLRIANVLCCLFWFVPLYPFVERRRREAAELACDDWAAARAGDAHGMARCLVRVAEWATVRQGDVGLALTGSSPISHRVERLLDPEVHGKRRVWPVVLVLALIPLAALSPRVAPGESQGSPHNTLMHRVVQEQLLVLRLPSASGQRRHSSASSAQ